VWQEKEDKTPTGRCFFSKSHTRRRSESMKERSRRKRNRSAKKAKTGKRGNAKEEKETIGPLLTSIPSLHEFKYDFVWGKRGGRVFMEGGSSTRAKIQRPIPSETTDERGENPVFRIHNLGASFGQRKGVRKKCSRWEKKGGRDYEKETEWVNLHRKLPSSSTNGKQEKGPVSEREEQT